MELAREGMGRLSARQVQEAYRTALEEQPHWLDSHPVLSQRLQSLGVEPPAEVCLDVRPARPASDLVDDYAAVRRRALERAEALVAFQLATEQRQARWRENRLKRDLEGPSQGTSRLVYRARLLWGQERRQEALELWAQVLQVEPDHVTAGRERLQALVSLDRLEEAATACDSLVPLCPRDIEVLMQAAWVYERAGRPRQAAGCLRSLLDLAPPPGVREVLQSRLERLEGNPTGGEGIPSTGG